MTKIIKMAKMITTLELIKMIKSLKMIEVTKMINELIKKNSTIEINNPKLIDKSLPIVRVYNSPGHPKPWSISNVSALWFPTRQISPLRKSRPSRSHARIAKRYRDCPWTDPKVRWPSAGPAWAKRVLRRSKLSNPLKVVSVKWRFFSERSELRFWKRSNSYKWKIQIRFARN